MQNTKTIAALRKELVWYSDQLKKAQAQTIFYLNKMVVYQEQINENLQEGNELLREKIKERSCFWTKFPLIKN